MTEPTSKEAEDVSWVLDSLVGFLKGPVWNLPILNFIEQKSVIFEPEDDEQNDALEAEYAVTFDQFKDLVDKLLVSHMQDLQISPEQFDLACTSARENLSAKLHALLFEQIWAASNYRIFKRMMIQRNIDLQLQALELLGQRMQLSNEALSSSSLRTGGELCKEEDELMQEILKSASRQKSSSKTDEKKHVKKSSLQQKAENKEQIGQDTNEAVLTDEEMFKHVQNANDEIQKTSEESAKVDSKQDSGKSPASGSSNGSSQPIIEKVLNQKSLPNGRPESSNLLEINNRKLSLIIGKKSDQISAEELEKRQNYLRMQRDKLIELKRKERSKQIVKVGERELKASRPKSAKAIKSTVEKGGDTDTSEQASKSDEDQGLAYRRTLASRLKAELIGSALGQVPDEKAAD